MQPKNIRVFPDEIRFSIVDIEKSIILNWVSAHKCNIKTNGFGGKYTYSFTPTSTKLITKAKCLCGEEIDLTTGE